MTTIHDERYSEDYDKEMAELAAKRGKELEELGAFCGINPRLWAIAAFAAGILVMLAIIGILAVGAYTIFNWIVG